MNSELNFKDIIIQDNFFDNITFEKIKNHIVSKINFTPRYFEGTKEKEKRYYGDRWQFNNDVNFKNVFVKQIEKKFNISIKKINEDCGIDMRNLDYFIPHDDADCGIINVLIMIKGPTAVSNGTVFYTDGELDMHVGFRENRALMFPSNKMHSPGVSSVSNLRRYTASFFIQEYDYIKTNKK